MAALGKSGHAHSLVEFMDLSPLTCEMAARPRKEAQVQTPIRLTSDEFDTIIGVANYALERLGRSGLSKERPTDLLLSVTEALRHDTFNRFAFLPLHRSISRDDLEFLAPYIDDWIAGQAPPQNLPAEYPDERLDQLRALRQRMQIEGFWPETPGHQ